MADNERSEEENNEMSRIDMFMTGISIFFLGFVILAIIVSLSMGTWPPFAHVQSGSMAPNIQPQDMLVVSDTNQAVPNNVESYNGIVTYRQGEEINYKKFGKHGDVIIFKQSGEPTTVHRAMYWVEEGENWVQKGNPEYLPEGNNCDIISNCPAEQSGFITKGDANDYYDQVMRYNTVQTSEVNSKARHRLPYFGAFRIVLIAVAFPLLIYSLYRTLQRRTEDE